jgi:hypothetical protein
MQGFQSAVILVPTEGPKCFRTIRLFGALSRQTSRFLFLYFTFVLKLGARTVQVLGAFVLRGGGGLPNKYVEALHKNVAVVVIIYDL